MLRVSLKIIITPCLRSSLSILSITHIYGRKAFPASVECRGHAGCIALLISFPEYPLACRAVSRYSSSSRRYFCSQIHEARSVRVFMTARFCPGWWFYSLWRYWPVCVGFRKTLWPSLWLLLFITSASKKGSSWYLPRNPLALLPHCSIWQLCCPHNETNTPASVEWNEVWSAQTSPYKNWQPPDWAGSPWQHHPRAHKTGLLSENKSMLCFILICE